MADDEAVRAAAQRVLARERSVQTQARLGRLVEEELRQKDGNFSVTPDRVRRLIATSPFARVEYRTRRGPRGKVLSQCPICGSGLSRVKNQTLFGGEVTLVLRCPTCGYWTGKEKRVPTYYMFHYRAAKAKPPSAEAAA